VTASSGSDLREVPYSEIPNKLVNAAGLIPQARVKIYPDSAHGFLFQHHAEFAADVRAFLSDSG